MTDKQIIGGRGSAKSYTTLNTIEVMLENEKLKKALKAKEQECEELKEQLKEMNEVIRTETTRCNLVNILKTELDQLKEQLEAYKMEADEGKEINAELKAENDELKKQVNDLLHKPEIQDKIFWKIDNEALLGSKDVYIYKLEKTLTEIKEICNNNDELKGDFNLVDCDKYKLGKHNLANKILQKISEVEE